MIRNKVYYMDYEIKILSDALPNDKISELYKKTFVVAYMESGANDWENVKYTDWYFQAYHRDRRFFYSAWIGDKLIATQVGTPTILKIDNEVEVKALSLGLCATDPEYQRIGIQKAMLKRLMEDARKAGFDLIYAFPEKGFGGNQFLKKNFEFKRYMKNQQHFIKVLGAYGRKILHDYRGLNIIFAKLLKLYDGIPKNELEGGEIRAGTDADIPIITKIHNSYQSRMQISQVWTESHVKGEIENAARMNEVMDEPSRFYWKIWERDGKVLATSQLRFEIIHFNKGNAPITLMNETCFHEDTTIEERAGFIATIVRWVQDTYPKVFAVQTTQPQYELKAFKSLKFIDDTSTYEFLVLPLSEKGEAAINKNEKYKHIFMPYHR